MFIWFGADVDGQLGYIREAAKAIEDELGIGTPGYALPMHISLKMSFEADGERAEAIIRDGEAYFSSLVPFEIGVKGMELDGPIAWIRMGENDDLRSIHDGLCDMLVAKYGIVLHEYDLDYKFHSTLFMNGDADKVAAAYDRIKDTPIPEKLRIDKYVIGTSPRGELGTYTVIKSISV